MEIGDIKELKIKLEILSKQCKMYEEIIDKMENTIRRLTDENKMLHSKQKI
jgi:prefoldin subunit 5